MLDAWVEFECQPELVRGARAFVSETLLAWKLTALTDEAVLVTSELVSNAVLHARTSVRLRLCSDGSSRVRVEVYDDNSRMPASVPCPDDATSGRGLNLVAALCGSWGCTYDGDGKVVWGELVTPPSGTVD